MAGPSAYCSSSAPIVLSHLSHLTARVQVSGFAAALLRRLDAPLTSLRLGPHGRSPPCNRAASPQIAQRLAASTRLHTLHVDSWSPSWAVTALSVALSGAPAAALQRVRVLQLTRCFSWVPGAVAQLPAAMPQLQGLALRMSRVRCRLRVRRVTTSTAAQAAWAQLGDHLQQLPLRHLDVAYAGSQRGPAQSIACPLTDLAVLRLERLEAPVDIVALSPLTLLRVLHVHDCALTEESRAGLVPSLRALWSLTNLALSGEGVPEAFAAGCEAQQLHSAWPALRVLGMHVAMSRPEAELQALVRAVCDLRALLRLVLMHNVARLMSRPGTLQQKDR